MASEIRTVGVISTGVIGSSWIALFLSRGLKVLIVSTSEGTEEKLSKYLERVWPSFGDNLAPGASPSNYKFVGPTFDGYYDQLDFVQENAPERLELKKKLFAELDANTRPEVIIASSTSGFPASKFITECKSHAGRIIVGHPFNPPHLIPLVEVVPHPGTPSDVSERAISFYKSLGKRPVLIKQEVPGFVANRLQAAVAIEAYSLVYRGVVSAEDLDTCMTESIGTRWALIGPFMAAVLGGGGKSGFTRLATHLLPAVREWAEDMKANTLDLSDDSIKTLDVSVQHMLDKYDLDVFERAFARQITGLLKLKNEVGATGHNLEAS